MTTAASHPRPWRRRPEAAPLRAWSSAELQRTAIVFEVLLRSWCEEWDLPVPAPGEVTCIAARDKDRQGVGAWACLGRDAGAAAWLQWEPDQEVRVSRHWFGPMGEEGCVAASVVQSCREDALRRIRDALQLVREDSRGAPDAAIWTDWSGAAVIHLPGMGLLLLDAGAMCRRAGLQAGPPRPAGAALVPVKEAMRSTVLSLHVGLDGCELGVGEFVALRVGDVLTLRHRVDAPAHVLQPDGDVLFSGWLARTRGRKSVELGPRRDLA